MIAIIELDGNQRRHLINVKQTYSAWREAHIALRRIGGMHWKTGPNGQDYLYSTAGRKEKALGPKSPLSEQIFAAHAERVSALQLRAGKARQALEKTARVSKALYLGRLPTIAARILRRLDDAGYLDGSLIVAGTNALFAYESGTGVLFDEPLIATEDLDLLWDPRRRMSLLLAEDNEASVLGLLQRVDRSFRKNRSYQAINDDTYLVDLIRPASIDEMFCKSPSLSQAEDDLEPAAIDGLAWLINAPRYEECAVAEDGLPARIVTVDPRAYALHKLWLSKRSDRSPLKRSRDIEQAHAVADVAINSLGLSFADEVLSAMPAEFMQGAGELETSIAKEIIHEL